MDKTALYSAYLGIAKLYLNINNTYLKNWRAFDKDSMKYQVEILKALNIYLKILKQYLDSFDIIKTIIEDKQIYAIIDESVKLVKLFKSYYNVR